MNKNLLVVFSSAILIILFSFLTENGMSNAGGPPAGKTGSPGDNFVTCAQSGCHTGMSVTPVTGWITSNVPVGGYVPGQTYTITATATQTSCVKFGFQISPQGPTGTYLGTMVVTDATHTQIVSTKYIEQKFAGTSGSTNSHTWTFDWTAPATGIGDVTFYGCFNCSNNNNGSGGDHIYTSTLIIPQCSASTIITANGPTTFCAGGNVTLDAGSGFATYHWSNSATTQTINIANAGNYSVTVTNSGGCPAVANSPAIIINPAPPVPIITPAGSTTFCQGASITLSVTVGSNSYHWSNNATTQTISVSTSGNYVVTVTNVNGCSSVSTSTAVTVNALPTPSIGGSTTICSGSSSVLDAGSGYTNYHWSTGASSQTITVSSAGIYSVTVTNVNGCTGSTTVTETVGSALTLTISSSGSNSICQGSSVTLDAGSGFSTYNWSNGFTAQLINVNVAGSYSVNVTNSNGCTGVSNTINVSVADTPICSAIVSPSTICSGDSAIANATSDSSWSYIWSPGLASGDTAILNPTLSATYTLTATNGNNCSGSFDVIVNVLPFPVLPTISQSGTILQCNSIGAVSFQWFLDGIEISGQTLSSINAGQQGGDYTVVITNSSGCQRTSLPFNYLGDGISDLNNSSVSLFPNPFSENISIQNLIGENEISLLNTSGEIIFRKTTDSKIEVVETSLLPSGIYLIKVKSDKEIINKVLMKN